jgi:hypothetical protein
MDKIKIPDITDFDIVLDNVPIRKLHNAKIIVFGNDRWDKVPANFHLFSEKDNYHGSFCLFFPRYYSSDYDIPHIALSQNQLKDLDKFLRKPHSFKTRIYESNWAYLINSHQDICERVNIGIDKEDQPDYTKTIPIEIKHHLSAPVKICEFDKYDVVIFKESIEQPHFHLISKDYKIDYPIQLFTYGQYILHPGCNIHQKMTIEECIVFNEWMSTHWDMIKTKFFEVNSFKKYESKYPETWKLMNTMSAPNYTNMITYEDLIEAETLEII